MAIGDDGPEATCPEMTAVWVSGALSRRAVFRRYTDESSRPLIYRENVLSARCVCNPIQYLCLGSSIYSNKLIPYNPLSGFTRRVNNTVVQLEICLLRCPKPSRTICCSIISLAWFDLSQPANITMAISNSFSICPEWPPRIVSWKFFLTSGSPSLLKNIRRNTENIWNLARL
jgi:hypothetical protein